ncbi:cupin domain-containing protein [Dethiothermospora halolimnae]|uniref:cupin domain-containing protein n=1 Tax=Dethiothermospora halolimnae TaxID=3114390 RepID=UPI003CCBBE17
MIVSHKDNVKEKRINNPEVKDALMKVLISPKEGWEGHVMRVFELGEGGHTPRHTHPWPHINYIIKGEGVLHLEGEDKEIKAGSFAYVPAGKLHQFMNKGKETLEFICIVPEEGHK